MRTIFVCIYYVLIYRLAQLKRESESARKARQYTERLARPVCMELEDDDYHDHDWDWPVVPPQENRIPSTALMRTFNPQRDWEEYASSIEYAQFVNDAEEDRL